jgi:3-oxoacyl-[acyl-carrier protein] reductase
MKRFEGQGILVTGGSRGIGRAVVLQAAAEGAQVVFCGRPESETSARGVFEAAGPLAANIHFCAADVSSEADVERLFEFALTRLPKLDVAVNNAGVGLNRLLVETSLEQWNQVMAVNVRGAYFVSRRAIDEFITGGGGRLVHVASIAANGGVGQAAYAASKSALLSMSRSIAKEYGRKAIASNAVVPGYIDTEMTAIFSAKARAVREQLSPQRRFGTAEEVAEAVLFLASKQASFITGDELYVAGAVRDVPRLEA